MQFASRELRSALPTAAIGFAEPVLSPWPVTGRIRNLAACRRILDLGCDPWHELPVLALWLRKATAAAIPGAELWTIPGMGHDLPVALNEKISEAISTHVKKAARG